MSIQVGSLLGGFQANFLISYDLKETKERYEKVEKAIRKVTTSSEKILTTTWLVESDKNINEIKEELKSVLKTEDECFILLIGDSCDYIY